MYFDFEDGHPDLARVPSALTAREGVLLSIIVHLTIALVACFVLAGVASGVTFVRLIMRRPAGSGSGSK